MLFSFFFLTAFESRKIALPSKRINLNRFNEDLPKNFDLKEIHPTCPSLTTPRNGSSCGASWMFASTGAYADSLCHTKNISVLPSPQFQVWSRFYPSVLIFLPFFNQLNCDKSCAPAPYQTSCNGMPFLCSLTLAFPLLSIDFFLVQMGARRAIFSQLLNVCFLVPPPWFILMILLFIFPSSRAWRAWNCQWSLFPLSKYP